MAIQMRTMALWRRDLQTYKGRTRMVCRVAALLVLLTWLLFGSPNISAAWDVKQVSIEGVWQGVISDGTQSVRILVQLQRQGDGYTGSFQIPDRSPETQPLSMLTFKEGVLHFSFAVLAIKWDGKLNDAGSILVGRASDGVSSYPLNLNRAPDAHPIGRSQEPKPPFPYSVSEVQFPNTQSRVVLAGTLTTPQTKGPFPAIVLMSGAGQTDRDGLAYGHKPFVVLADYLTRRGFMVLRLDDRGVGKSEGDAGSATLADIASDVAASVIYLKSMPGAGKIGAIGYGTGGSIASMAAISTPNISFIVLMGSPALDGRRILEAQATLMAKSRGAAEEEIRMIRRFQARAFGILTLYKGADDTSANLVAAMTEEIAKLPAGRRAGWLSVMSAMTRMYNTPWMRYFTSYDPAQALKNIACPVLALYGETDHEVAADTNAAAMEAMLKDGKSKDHTVLTLPVMNHLFQISKTGNPVDYEKIDETLALGALKTVGDWIEGHAK